MPVLNRSHHICDHCMCYMITYFQGHLGNLASQNIRYMQIVFSVASQLFMQNTYAISARSCYACVLLMNICRAEVVIPVSYS